MKKIAIIALSILSIVGFSNASSANEDTYNQIVSYIDNGNIKEIKAALEKGVSANPSSELDPYIYLAAVKNAIFVQQKVHCSISRDSRCDIVQTHAVYALPTIEKSIENNNVIATILLNHGANADQKSPNTGESANDVNSKWVSERQPQTKSSGYNHKSTDEWNCTEHKSVCVKNAGTTQISADQKLIQETKDYEQNQGDAYNFGGSRHPN